MLRLTNVAPPWWNWNVPLSTGLTIAVVVVLAPLFGWALAREEWLIVGGLGAVALTPAFIRWPVVSTLGVYALLVSSFDGVPLFQGVATLSRPAGVLAGGVLIIAGLMERRLVRPPAAAVWWGIFLLWGIVSAAWAVDAEMTFRRLTTSLSVYFLYLVTVSFRPSRKEFYGVCVLTVLGGVMAATVGYLFGLEGAPRGRLVVGGMESNPNALALSLVLPLPLAIAGFIGSRTAVQKAMALAAVGLIGVGMYITMSRNAVLSMMIMIAVLLYRLQARKQIVAIAVTLAALTALMPQGFFQRIERLISGEDATGSGRTDIWQMGLDALDQFWLFGAGLHNFPAVSGRAGAHNSYLAVTVELGVVGLALMLAAIGSHLLDLRRARKAGHASVALAAVEAALLGMLAGTMFSDRVWSKSFWIIWTLLVWAVHCARRPDPVPEVGPRVRRRALLRA